MNINIFIFGVVIGFAVALMIIGFVTNADRLDSRKNLEEKNRRLRETLYSYQSFVMDSGFTELYREYVKRIALGITDEEEDEEPEEQEEEADEWEEEEEEDDNA